MGIGSEQCGLFWLPDWLRTYELPELGMSWRIPG
jgi:hypothetical protein